MYNLIFLCLLVGAFSEPAAPPAPSVGHAALMQRFAQRAKVSNKVAAADIMAAVSQHGAEIADTNALAVYTRFLQANKQFTESLASMFEQFDKNHDGKIDFAEIAELEKKQSLSSKNCAIVRSWDVDHDGCVSMREFSLGPLYLSMLQNTNKAKHEEYHATVSKKKQTKDDLSAFTALFSRVASGEAEQPARFMQDENEDAEAEADENESDEVSAEEEEETEDEQASNAFRFSTAEMEKRKKKKKKSKPSGPRRPKSKFGVPSFFDEGCVMCQFLVQRIQRQLYYTLATSADAYPADPKAEITEKKMKSINAQITNKRGGKGLLRIIGEDIISDMCDPDTMPELFYPYCDKLKKRFPLILDGIFFQFNAEAICEEAKFCTPKTYFNRPSSVHLPSKSRVLNSGRGLCGMIGGAHQRPNKKFNAAVCFAGRMSF